MTTLRTITTGSIIKAAAIAGLLALSPVAASAACSSNGQLCMSASTVPAGSGARVSRINASASQSWCGLTGSYHIEFLIQDNANVMHPSWWPLNGNTRWSGNSPSFQHTANTWKCFDTENYPYPDSHSYWMAPANCSMPTYPHGWYACAILWKYNGGTNYSVAASACQRL